MTEMILCFFGLSFPNSVSDSILIMENKSGWYPETAKDIDKNKGNKVWTLITLVNMSIVVIIYNKYTILL